MADLRELGDSPDRRCWPRGDRVPDQAEANNPNHPAADQVSPAVKGDRGRVSFGWPTSAATVPGARVAIVRKRSFRTGPPS